MTDIRVLLLVAAALAAGTAAAQTYRWVDQNGKVHYSNIQPPKGVQATVVDPDSKAGPPATESSECYTVRCQGERMEERQRKRDAEDARYNAERAAQAARQPKGLDFRKYVSIQRGMSEGELLSIAGEPDMKTDQGAAYAVPATVQADRNFIAGANMVARAIVYTYLPTPADPFTTTITLIGGRVSELERVRKF
jgi:hypothetical protein